MLTDTAILNDSEKEYYICLDTRVKRQKLIRQLKRQRGKSCVNSIKTRLLGENYGRNNFYQGCFST